MVASSYTCNVGMSFSSMLYACAPNLCTTMSWSVSSLSNRLKSSQRVTEHGHWKVHFIAAWALWDYWRSCDLQPQPYIARITNYNMARCFWRTNLWILQFCWQVKKIVTQCHECPTNKSGIEMPSFRPSHCEVPAKVSANLNEDPMLLCNIERVIWKFTSIIFEAAGRTVCEFICWSWPCLPTDSWP